MKSLALVFDRTKLIYLIVGFINTIFGYSIYYLLIVAGLSAYLCVLISTVAGVVFNYVTNGKFVFCTKHSLFALIRYVFMYCVIYLINIAMLSLILNVFGINPIVAQLICLPFNVVIAWFLMKYFVFKAVNFEKN